MRYWIFGLALMCAIACKKKDDNERQTFIDDDMSAGTNWTLTQSGENSAAEFRDGHLWLTASRDFVSDTIFGCATYDFAESAIQSGGIERICLTLDLAIFEHHPRSFQSWPGDANFRLYLGTQYITLSDQFPHYMGEGRLHICHNAHTQTSKLLYTEGEEEREIDILVETKEAPEPRWALELYTWSSPTESSQGLGSFEAGVDAVELYTY